MNRLFLIIFSLSIVACSEPREPSDDYVLIEFASKLEEEYAKLEKDSE